VLVSHDRFSGFDDREDPEIRNRAITLQGDIRDFLRQREERLVSSTRHTKEQQREIARIKAFADKFRYKGTKAAQVQSRLKELERMERIELPPNKTGAHPLPAGARTGGRFSNSRRDSRIRRQDGGSAT